jgi:hypothetical protein
MSWGYSDGTFVRDLLLILLNYQLGTGEQIAPTNTDQLFRNHPCKFPLDNPIHVQVSPL